MASAFKRTRTNESPRFFHDRRTSRSSAVTSTTTHTFYIDTPKTTRQHNPRRKLCLMPAIGTLNRWINNNCIIVGTMARSAYTERHHKEFEQLTGWDVVNRFQILHLSTLLSQNEFHRIGTTSYSRIASEVKEIGLGPSLSCAQDVRNALTEEHTSHSQRLIHRTSRRRHLRRSQHLRRTL